MIGKEKNTWLLPEGIEEILPPDAARLENICNTIIESFQTWGYQLVIPPMVEYLDSLLTGTGEDLELQTFKITDLLTGRLMGIRADITPQIARIDSHYLRRDVPERLCYLGTVLHTKPENHSGTRSPLQVGAELFGHEGIESDVEVICLLLDTFEKLGITNVHVDIGHVGIVESLISDSNLHDTQQQKIFDILQRKALPEISSITTEWKLNKNIQYSFEKLIELHGDIDVLDVAEDCYKSSSQIKKCIDDLRQLHERVLKRYPNAPLYYDLAELRGYHYHTGIMFSAYVPGKGTGIAHGGRYDDVGISFGRSRAATGFSADVKLLMELSNIHHEDFTGIFAPDSDDKTLASEIDSLRAAGEIVICELPGQTGDAKAMGCDKQLIKESGKWVVKSI